MIVTFYSYKGGVGRTMALANVASQLANRHGQKVLVIDWDLEAPGIHFYFGHRDAALHRQKGLIDLLTSPDKDWSDIRLSSYLMKSSKEIRRQLKFGKLDILPCGKIDENYMQRVSEFSWPDFYDDQDGYDKLQILKDVINTQYDICLIDARAGQSDTNVPATSQMADLLVILFTSNRQSITGTEEICERLFSAKIRSFETKPVPIILVPSRVFPFQASYQKWFSEEAEPMYHRLLKAGILKRSDQPNGLGHVTLPVEPDYTVGEQLPILQSDSGGLGLVNGYRDLVELLLDHKNADDLLWRPDRLRDGGAVNEQMIGRLRRDLADAATRGDEATAATIRLRLARYLREFGRLNEAESLAVASLTYLRSRNDTSLQALALHTLGQIENDNRHYDEAIKYYTAALNTLGDSEDSRRGVIFHDIGVTYIRREDFEQADSYLERSLEIKGRMGDKRGLALTMHQLGNLAFSRENLDLAALTFQKAVDLAEEAHDRLGAAISLHQLGNVSARRGDIPKAIDFFNLALEIHRNYKNIRGSGITLRRIGDLYFSLEEYEAALDNYTSALASAHSEGDLINSGKIHRLLGSTYMKLNQWENANSQITTALALAQSRGDDKEMGRSLILLSEIDSQAGRESDALYRLREAEALAFENSDETLLRRVREARERLRDTEVDEGKF